MLLRGAIELSIARRAQGVGGIKCVAATLTEAGVVLTTLDSLHLRSTSIQYASGTRRLGCHGSALSLRWIGRGCEFTLVLCMCTCRRVSRVRDKAVAGTCFDGGRVVGLTLSSSGCVVAAYVVDTFAIAVHHGAVWIRLWWGERANGDGVGHGQGLNASSNSIVGCLLGRCLHGGGRRRGGGCS